MKTTNPFISIPRRQLVRVSGGARRVASSSRNGQMDQQMQMMLAEIGNAIKSINQNQGGDMMMPMMMMMMMGGGSGGGASAGPPPPPPPPPPQAAPTYVRVNVRR